MRIWYEMVFKNEDQLEGSRSLPIFADRINFTFGELHPKLDSSYNTLIKMRVVMATGHKQTVKATIHNWIAVLGDKFFTLMDIYIFQK
jgi:hypothetical protein